MTKSKQVLGLVGWLLMTFMAAGIGSVASSKAGAFYQQLIRPEWAPPAWIFGPVWTMLYLLMGIAAWLVWRVQVNCRRADFTIERPVVSGLYLRFHMIPCLFYFGD